MAAVERTIEIRCIATTPVGGVFPVLLLQAVVTPPVAPEEIIWSGQIDYTASGSNFSIEITREAKGNVLAISTNSLSTMSSVTFAKLVAKCGDLSTTGENLDKINLTGYFPKGINVGSIVGGGKTPAAATEGRGL